MLETRERYVLHNFPILVDPVAASLEVQLALCRVAPGGGIEQPAPAPVWRQLRRVRVQHDTFPFTLTSRMIHFFGLEDRAADCTFLLAYDSAGVLRYRIDKEEGEFVAHQVPEEINARPVIRHSVRVTFDDPDDAQRFAAMTDMARGGTLRPEGVAFLAELAGRSRETFHTLVARKP